MAGLPELSEVLKIMKPKIQPGEYIFCVVSEAKFRTMNIKALCTFKEKEGISAILDRPSADGNAIQYSSVWKMISLSVNSSLESIGMLAAISTRFAKERIPLNVISAYHHDHLFVPVQFAEKAMALLKKIGEEA